MPRGPIYRDGMVNVPPGLSFDVSVPLTAQRNWQRRWRDVLHAREAIAEEYDSGAIRVDHLTRCIETFFKTCHELIDWIDESTSLDAKTYAKSSPTLLLCNAAAQTAKHYKRNQADAITVHVVELFGDQPGRVRAEVKWTSKRSNGTADALALADRCIAEWNNFFQLHQVDPNA
ncbi:MAG: hypothetical protein QOG14_3152 [Mycobacterium sp.]|jgi:hypothetical protein|nr:hypothetical protein [Mycobacterium sp.]